MLLHSVFYSTGRHRAPVVFETYMVQVVSREGKQGMLWCINLKTFCVSKSCLKSEEQQETPLQDQPPRPKGKMGIAMNISHGIHHFPYQGPEEK